MSQPGEASDLQFDRADFGGQPAATTCMACHQPIVDRYFDVNGKITCPTCRDAIAHTLDGPVGSMAPLLALGAGLAGGLVGALLYYTILAMTGYEIGLIAIVVGLLVGRAVRWGSGGRGGRGYQVMAVAITYLAIVSTYMPFIIAGLRQGTQEATTSTAQTTAANPERTAANTERTTPATSNDATPSEADGPPPSIFLVLGFLFVLMVISPFLGGFENIIGWVIIGIALWEAWKANGRVAVAIAGPFTIGAAGSPPPATPAAG